MPARPLLYLQDPGYPGELEYHDKVRPGKKKVVIIRQVAGQGAMYDTWMFPDEPSGVEGGRSIIDMGNMPVMITPNEYRDGIIRSMQ